MAKHAQSITLLDSEIIQLYDNGLSQQDILRLYGVPVIKTRAVLQDAGFHTANYRKVPLEFEEIIYVLLHAGISYRRIAEVTDISQHVIRSIAERRPNPTVEKRRNWIPLTPTQREATFLQYYLSGQCFCVLGVYLELREQEILNCYALLDATTLQAHRRALHCRLEEEDMQQNTVSSLARKYGISASTIKAHLNI